MAIWTILVLSAAVVGAAPTMRLRGGSTGKLSLETMISAANDPEAIAELKALMQDPEALAEARQLMDDPEFRAQVQEALSEGGADGLQRLQSQLGSSGDDNDLSSGLRALGPSLGAALDLLKSDVTADEFKAACGVLSSLVQRRLKEGAERVGAEGPRLRLANDKLQERLLRHTHGRRCLTALGFTEEVEGGEDDGDDARRGAMLEVGETVVLDAPQLTRARAVIDEALADSSRASEISAAHGLPYKLALELPTVRRACQGEESLGQQVTALFLEHAEFRAMVCTPELSEQALPSILPLLRSRDGLLALIEFFTGAGPPEGTKVTSVSTLTEWKDALAAAGDRLVVAFFSNTIHLGCRVLGPMFLRLPDHNEGEFADSCAFIRVQVDARTDDGLAQQVFAEAAVPETQVPTFAFFVDCLELRKWRMCGSSDAGELVRRTRRIAADPNDPALEEGPEEQV